MPFTKKKKNPPYVKNTYQVPVIFFADLSRGYFVPNPPPLQKRDALPWMAPTVLFKEKSELYDYSPRN